jgi:hypothetical protein
VREKNGGMENVIMVTFFLLIISPLWVPIPFLYYAITRKRFSLVFLFLLLTAEAISLTVAKLRVANTRREMEYQAEQSSQKNHGPRRR